MKTLLMTGATLFLLATFGGRAGAAQVFQWTGPCDEGCMGSATATLTLDDSYVLGNPLGTGVFPNPYFVAFSYSSTSGTIDVPGDAEFNFMQGSIPAVLPGPSTGVEIDFFDPTNSYFCAPNGPALAVNCPAVGWTSGSRIRIRWPQSASLMPIGRSPGLGVGCMSRCPSPVRSHSSPWA